MTKTQFQRYCVLGGVLQCIAGLITLIVSVAIDANQLQMSLVESEWAKRAATGALGLVFILFGVGIARLRPWVLYALPIFFTVGLIIQTAAEAYEYSPQPAPPIWVMFSGAVVTLMVVLAMIVGIRSLWHPVERTAFLNGLSPEQRTAYTFSVAPLGVFLLIAAVSSLTLISILPTDRINVPFLETGLGKRAFFFGVGLLYALLGVGMVRLWRWAWYLLLAVIVGGGVLLVVGVEISRLGGKPSAEYVPAIVIVGSFNAVFAMGIWVVTRRAFRQSHTAE